MDAIILYLAKLWLEINSCEEQLFQDFLLGNIFRHKFRINGIRIPARNMPAVIQLYQNKPGYFACWNKWNNKAVREEDDYFVISVLREYESFIRKVPGQKYQRDPGRWRKRCKNTERS